MLGWIIAAWDSAKDFAASRGRCGVLKSKLRDYVESALCYAHSYRCEAEFATLTDRPLPGWAPPLPPEPAEFHVSPAFRVVRDAMESVRSSWDDWARAQSEFAVGATESGRRRSAAAWDTMLGALAGPYGKGLRIGFGCSLSGADVSQAAQLPRPIVPCVALRGYVGQSSSLLVFGT